MYEVAITNLSKSYGTVRVLHEVNLTIRRGERFFLLGPSGCGKTTLLRILAGFETLGSGTITFDGADASQIPAQRRNASLVFQNYALWPHMTVEQNVSFGLEGRNLDRSEVRSKTREALDLVRMGDFAGRFPNQLSGGQQQRVALARALVVNPDLLLLDEPLSNLDARLREEMRFEILRLHEQTGVTMLYVTHDQEEAMSLAQRMAFMDEGKIVQLGTPQELYENPGDIRTARFLGNANFLEGTVSDIRENGVSVETSAGTLNGKSAEGASLAPGQKAVCFFRPEKMSKECAENLLVCKLAGLLFVGGFYHANLDCAGVSLQALLDAQSGLPQVGSEITLGVPSDAVAILHKEGESPLWTG